MSSQDHRSAPPPKPMMAREQLERLYREIGIPAVASAAHMASRTAKKAEKSEKPREIPPVLRDESFAA